MKNKLLKFAVPFATIAATTPIVALTGCSCNQDKPTFEIDLSKEYQPTGTQLEGSYKNSEMTTKYYEFIAANPIYLAEDMALDRVSASTNEEWDSGTIKVWINNIDSVNQKISLKFEMDATVVVGTETATCYEKFEINNVCYVCKGGGTGTEGFDIVLGWSDQELISATDWNMSINVNYAMPGYEPYVIDFSASNNSSTDDKNTAYSYLEQEEIYSYYMEKCTHAAE